MHRYKIVNSDSDYAISVNRYWIVVQYSPWDLVKLHKIFKLFELLVNILNDVSYTYSRQCWYQYNQYGLKLTDTDIVQ